MTDIINQIKQSFKNGDILTRLIFVNVGVYLFIVAVRIIFGLFTSIEVGEIDGFSVKYLGVPTNNLTELIFKFHTLITHLFLHITFNHILSNMILLYFLGKIFLSYFTPKKLLGLYFLGGFIGIGLLEIISIISPKFQEANYAYGASAAVMAIVVGVCAHAPKSEVRLFGILPIKLMWLGAGIVLLDFVNMMDENTGGHIAHIGGAITGYYFAKSHSQGKDITKGINTIISKIVSIFKPGRRMKVVHSQENVRNMSDEEYNKSKKANQEEIDKILDKISASGYASLSKQEKENLFKFSNRK
jgi:membrane associated rhomboid family serine protease|tara:strand:+ start:490 stop:1392 length:903 start_codon:yes stop_codon:yes gene_type:complete